MFDHAETGLKFGMPEGRLAAPQKCEYQFNKYFFWLNNNSFQGLQNCEKGDMG